MKDIDIKILSILQEKGDIPIAELAKMINLSTTPCWARVQKLQKLGVIRKRVALLDPQQLNLNLVAIMQIKTVQHNEEWLRKLVSVVSKMSEVVEFYRLSGDIDYMLKVVVADMAAYDALYHRLTSQITLTTVTTSFVMESIKNTSKLPLNYL